MVLSRQLTWLLLYHVLLIFTLYEDFKLVFMDMYLSVTIMLIGYLYVT